MIRYSTIQKEGQAELIIEKSRFIGYVKPVETREEADAFIKEIKARHRDATHNVPAFVIGEKFQQQWASDDGEPQGTSGVPMLQMMVKEGITNVVVVVTRYFGGIKLGTGGLVRAYTNTAKAALEDAGIHHVKDQTVIVASMDYTHLGKLQNA
ncbi:MAG: YigZ family protein, partial [Firmicutes bacterium]|nr:YigZ family protein [Bacillota bacterium]